MFETHSCSGGAHHASGHDEGCHQRPQLQLLADSVRQAELDGGQAVQQMGHHCVRQLDSRHQVAKLSGDVAQGIAVLSDALQRDS